MDISNKTLAILVVIAIIVSLIGLFIGKTKLVTTGRPTDTGIVQATVLENVEITVDYAITFGDPMVIGQSANSEGTGDSACNPCYAIVGSTGTTPADIRYWAETNLWYRNSAGTYDVTREFESTDFQMSVQQADGMATYNLGETYPLQNLNACTNGYTAWGLDVTTPGNYKQIEVQTAGEFAGIAANCQQWEGFRVGALVIVPPNEQSGVHQATLTFEAIQYAP